MIESDGVVVRIEGEYAWIRAEGAGSACGACSRKEGCHGGSVLDGALGQPVRLLRLVNTIQARPGDAVVISVADGVVLRAVWLAYGIPLVLALLGAMLALALVGSELATVAGTLLGLFGGYLIMRNKGIDSGRKDPILSLNFKRSPFFLHEV
jgi:sigma-E factor negative regulatory protein RseC